MKSIKKSIKDLFVSLKERVKKEVKKETPYFISEKLITMMFYHRHQTDPRHYFSEKWFKDLHFQREIFRNKDSIFGNISIMEIISS